MKKVLSVFLLLAMLCLFGCGDKQPAATTEDTIRTEQPEATLAPLVTEATTPTVPTETRIRFAAAGDNIAHDSVVATAAGLAKDGEKYDFTAIYAGIADLVSSADLAFVNQEAPVGGEELGISGYPNFNAPHEMVEGLIDAGFDIFTIANNHMLDKGEKGYANTIEYFNGLPVTMIGGYTKSDYDNIRTVECKGVKIALLGYTTLINYSHKNDVSASSAYVVPYANEADLKRQVALAKECADVVIVTFHWGTEDVFTVTPEQQKYARLCADLGVDVVLGHHPHVVGGVEYLTGESGSKTLVAYSLGNLCSTMLYGKNMVGEILTFDIVKDADGIITVENAVVEPVVSHYKTDTSRNDSQGLAVRYDSRVYLMRDYTDALAAEHGANNWGKFTFSDLKKLITDNTSPEFLPDFLK